MIPARATDFASFRAEARRLLRAGAAPADVVWEVGPQTTLFRDDEGTTRATDEHPSERTRVPASFLAEAEIACDHRDPDRFATLYRLLSHIAQGGKEILDDPLDPDVARLRELVRDVREEEHHMHAFVRFRPVVGQDGTERLVGWVRPAHDVLRRVAPFFARRYPALPWTLFTPTASAHWDGHALRFGEGAPASECPPPDALDALFVTYYSNIFNPARVNLPLFSKHVPRRIREQLPEAPAIRGLGRGALGRVEAMKAKERTSVPLPARRDLPSLAASVQGCRACPIGEHATQAVFGEGAAHAKLVIVGEQPGDEEDRKGRPFVGPAGRVFDEMMEKAAIDRSHVYVTNAVKHFKWEPRGKRRLHSRPNMGEVDTCKGWLLAELEAIRPAMILCLGATAAQSFCGPKFRVQRDRGKPTATPWAPWWMATYHPSAVLRASSDREAIAGALLDDLRLAKAHLETLDPATLGRATLGGDSP